MAKKSKIFAMRVMHYHISGSDILTSLCTGLSGLPYARRHWKIANHPATENRWGHRLVAILEFSPIVGLVVAILERLVASILGWDSNPLPDPNATVHPPQLLQEFITDYESRLKELDPTKKLLERDFRNMDSMKKELESLKLLAGEDYRQQVEDVERRMREMEQTLKVTSSSLNSLREEAEKPRESLINLKAGLKEAFSQPFLIGDTWKIESELTEADFQGKSIITRKIIPLKPEPNYTLQTSKILGFQVDDRKYYLANIVVTPTHVELTYVYTPDIGDYEETYLPKYTVKNATKYPLHASHCIKKARTIEPLKTESLSSFHVNLSNLKLKTSALLFATALYGARSNSSDPIALRGFVNSSMFEPRVLGIIFNQFLYGDD